MISLYKVSRLLVLSLAWVAAINADENSRSSHDQQSSLYRYCVVESCAGCRLIRMKQLHQFVREDLPAFHNAEFRAVPGKDPEMIFYDRPPDKKGAKKGLGRVVERLDLAGLDDRRALNRVMRKRGFRPGDGGSAAGAPREGDAVRQRLQSKGEL